MSTVESIGDLNPVGSSVRFVSFISGIRADGRPLERAPSPPVDSVRAGVDWKQFRSINYVFEI